MSDLYIFLKALSKAGFFLMVIVGCTQKNTEKSEKTFVQLDSTISNSAKSICEKLYDDIEKQLLKANHCNIDSDCKILLLGGRYIEFGCYHYINKKTDEQNFFQNMEIYEKKCNKMIDKCMPTPNPICVAGKCVSQNEGSPI